MARQRFSAQFKREAVKLLETSGKHITQLALELGVPRVTRVRVHFPAVDCRNH